ncbi:ABC transporter permease [Haoranjiania flava]|uniref:ABC transporter permease n=1 Tax=Haoranjiania flava TaxID=1856322 RepID=A0AAE3ILT4_9BACT|nr:ABC transporter permease [Haoranjiania flava]MCU7693351.1 ABC transporter permease [Haoranjiania flava]
MEQKKGAHNVVWHKLKRNKLAVAGLAVILLSCVLAVFAYFIAPDTSPNANRMIPEIANKKPGFSSDFLLVKNPVAASEPGFFKRLLSGKPDDFVMVPVKGISQSGDTVYAGKFIDVDVYETIAIPVKDLASPEVVHRKFYFGTDKFGRDIFSRLIVGTRVSLSVGLIAVIISLTLGILLGALAGYFRGRTDNIIMWFVNVVWSIPTLLLVFAITFILGKGFWQVFVAVGFTLWVSVARLVRGQVMAIRKLEYVEAGKVLGFSNFRIIVRHILPNILGPILVMAASNFASAIVIEAGLSFLGVGVQPPQPSWGLMIKENYNFIITNNPMLALAPGIAIMILVLAFNLLGNGLRDAFDVVNE